MAIQFDKKSPSMLSEVLPPFDYPIHSGVIGDENNDRGFEYDA